MAISFETLAIVKKYISKTCADVDYVTEQLSSKEDKTIILSDASSTEYVYDFGSSYNTEVRLQSDAISAISFTFSDGEYDADYTAGLAFDTGDTPPEINYTNSGILNWVGTDCALSEGQSIFAPSANKHYDVVFYFNGTQFIGLVNGFAPATVNSGGAS